MVGCVAMHRSVFHVTLCGKGVVRADRTGRKSLASPFSAEEDTEGAFVSGMYLEGDVRDV